MTSMTSYRQVAIFLWASSLASSFATPLSAENPQTSVIGVAVDYPMRALREGRQGTVFFTVVVGPLGTPKSCTVTISSGHADLDHAACHKVMRTAKFASAADTADQADRSFSSKTEFKISE